MEHSLCSVRILLLNKPVTLVHMRECGLDSLVCSLLDVSLAGINNPEYCLHFLLRI